MWKAPLIDSSDDNDTMALSTAGAGAVHHIMSELMQRSKEPPYSRILGGERKQRRGRPPRTIMKSAVTGVLEPKPMNEDIVSMPPWETLASLRSRKALKHWRPICDSSDASSVAFTAIERKRFRSIAHTGGPRGASDGSWF